MIVDHALTRRGLASTVTALAALLACSPATNEAPSAPRREPSRPLRIAFVGDILLADSAQPLLDRHGYAFPFAKLAGLLAGHDLLVGNLEGPITAHDVPIDPDKPRRYRARPAAAAALRAAGFDLLCLANNHILDYGARGLEDTRRALDAAGIAHFGAGATESLALAPHVVEVAGVRIGFVGFMQTWREYDERYRWFASAGRGGVAPMTKRALQRSLAELRPRVDFLVVSFHWGGEYEPFAAPKQKRFARLAIELGADLVVGHHPHVAQGVELHRGVPVLYSLGNFSFGTDGRYAEIDPVWRHGWLADVTFAGGRVAQVELAPIAVDNRAVGHQPRPADPAVLPALVEVVQRGLDTRLEIADGRARLVP